MNYITIYKVIDKDDEFEFPSYYKGIEQLRQLGKERIFNGCPTNFTKLCLNNDENLFSFFENDYGVNITVVAQVSISDFKNQ